MRRRRSFTGYWTAGIVVGVVGLVSAVFLVSTVKPTTTDRVEEAKSAPADITQLLQPVPSAQAGKRNQTRRMPVAGAPGFFIVVNPDGTSYLEKPSGQRQVLVDAAQAAVPDPGTLALRVKEKMEEVSRPKPKTEIGQLVVLDRGVVDVPKGAVITFTGPDRAVVLNEDGISSTVFHSDGRVERRERKKPLSGSSGKE